MFSSASRPAWSLAVLCLLVCHAAMADDSPPNPRAMRVMTFNVRWANPFDCGNAWPYRRDWVAEIVRAQGPDILGCQEVLKSQRDDLCRRLPDYVCIFAGRNDGKDRGEAVPIFYRKDRFEELERSVFWLSPTPEQPGSRGWGATLPRITTRVRLKDRRTGRTLSVFNTHLDHQSAAAREESARLLRERIAAVPPGDEVILTGDFNCLSSSEPYRLLTADEENDQTGAGRPSRLYDGRTVAAEGHEGPDSTWNGFVALVPRMQIDFIFVSRPEIVRRHRIVDERKEGRFPSDHLPVLVELVFPEGV